MKRYIHLALCFALPVVLLTGCTDDLVGPDRATAPTALSEGPSDEAMGQAVATALANGASAGAMIDRSAGCFLFAPTYDSEGELVAVAAIFGLPFFGADCERMTRTNPDGTQDVYTRGTGPVFFIVPGLGTWSSSGSDGRWQIVNMEEGIYNLIIRGTLGTFESVDGEASPELDGNRFRVHRLVNQNTGEDGSAADAVWVQGLGYLLHPGGN